MRSPGSIIARDRVQQRRLARAGAARNQDVEPRSCAAICSNSRHRPRQSPCRDHHVERDALLGEFADRDACRRSHERRQDDVDAAAVGQPGIDHRARLRRCGGRPPTAMRCATLTTCCVVAEPRVGPLELAAPLDVDLSRPVDQDVGDLVVVEQRLERAEADHVVDQFERELALFAARSAGAAARSPSRPAAARPRRPGGRAPWWRRSRGRCGRGRARAIRPAARRRRRWPRGGRGRRRRPPAPGA